MCMQKSYTKIRLIQEQYSTIVKTLINGLVSEFQVSKGVSELDSGSE